MRKEEFLILLEKALTGSVATSEILSQCDFYSSYIESEKASGKTEEEIIEQLGEPELIARTIIDAKERAGTADDGQRERGSYYKEEKRTERIFRFNTWYGKLLSTLILIAVVVLFFLIIGGVITLLVKIAFPLMIVLAFIVLVKTLRKQ